MVEQLKARKLTFRNVPLGVAPADGPCLFTGEPAVERILVLAQLTQVLEVIQTPDEALPA